MWNEIPYCPNPEPTHQEKLVFLLEAILSELQAIRQATETEAVEDAEPGPFQTLNGPVKKTGCGKKLKKGQHWAFCGETDMGQSLPALCTECGGPFALHNPQGIGGP